MVSSGLSLALALSGCASPDPPARPEQVLAADNSLSWYRGNLHAHSLWSDGEAFPDTVAAWYRDNGYQFLAFTEHNLLPEGEHWIDTGTLRPPARRALADIYPGNGEDQREREGRREVRLRRHDELVAAFARPGTFLLLRGEEISDNVGPVSIHVNAVNLPAAVPPARRDEVNRTIEADYEASTRAAGSSGDAPLLQLNHPNFVHSVTAEHLMRLQGSPFFEVYNGHPLSNNASDGLRPSTERMWDIALAWRLDVLGLPPLYATATDDSHSDPAGGDAPAGRGWIMVLADELAPERLFDAMRLGRFYASSGVGLQRIVATDDRLEVEVSAEPGVDYTIEFIGTRTGFDASSTSVVSATGRQLYASRRYSDTIGKVFARHDGSRAIYRFRPDDLYVRARVTASRRHPNPSQPAQFEQAWVQPAVGPAGRQPHRAALAAPEPAATDLHFGVTRRMQPMPASEAGQLIATATNGMACALDAVSHGNAASGLQLRSGGLVQFSGWIGNPAKGHAADWLAIVLHSPDQSYVAEGAPTRIRPDVAKALDAPALEASGYVIGSELVGVASGDYRVWLVGYIDGKPGACDSRVSLRVD